MIDIPRRELRLDVPDFGWRRRRGAAGLLGGLPAGRPAAVGERRLQVYAALATSASTGASRDISALARLAPETA